MCNIRNDAVTLRAENDIGIMINDPNPNNPNSNILLTSREFQHMHELHRRNSDHQRRRMFRIIRNEEG